MAIASYILLVGVAVGGATSQSAEAGIASRSSTPLEGLSASPYSVSFGELSVDSGAPAADFAALRTGGIETQDREQNALQGHGTSALPGGLMAIEMLGPGVPCGATAWADMWLPAPAPSRAAIHYLPGLPTSAELFLTTVLGLGAWHIVRRPPHLDFQLLEQWCGADMIAACGHGAAVDRQLTWPSAFFLAEPARAQRVFQPRWRGLSARCTSPFFRSVQAARAPPTAARHVFLTALCSAPRVLARQ